MATKLTKDEIIAGYVTPSAKILAFGLAQADNVTVDEIVDAVKAGVAGVDPQHPVTVDELIEQVFTIAETASKQTETHKDDAVVAAVHAAYELIEGKTGAVAALIALIKAKRAAKG